MGGHFGVLGVPWGPFWGSGGAPGRLRRAMAFKDPWWLLAPRHFERFWRSKVARKAPKMELESVKNGVKIRLTFLFDLSLVYEAFFDD